MLIQLVSLLTLVSTGSAVAVTPTVNNYQIDPAHSSVIFGVSHMGISYTYGRFNKVSGNFLFDKENPTAGSFSVAFDVNSIDTNDGKRDEHLRSPEFFDAQQFPELTFRSSNIKQTGDAFELTGIMSLHGVEKEISISIRHMGEAQDPFGNYRSGFLTAFSVKRSDFGMNAMIGPVGDEIHITFSFEGIKQ